MFPSKAWSSETLARGLDKVSEVDMSIAGDPDKHAMLEELARLQESQIDNTIEFYKYMINMLLNAPCFFDSLHISYCKLNLSC